MLKKTTFLRKTWYNWPLTLVGDRELWTWEQQQGNRRQMDQTRTRTFCWLYVLHIFTNLGLKKFGKDWDKIEDKIPTRTGTQIRSHAQKFFARIRREFNTKDPMEYVTKNMWDNSRIYNFDSFRDQQNLGDKQTSEYKEMNLDGK